MQILHAAIIQERYKMRAGVKQHDRAFQGKVEK